MYVMYWEVGYVKCKSAISQLQVYWILGELILFSFLRVGFDFMAKFNIIFNVYGEGARKIQTEYH